MSDGFSLDFTDVEGGQFDAIPRGRYLVAVTDWSTTEVKNEGGKLAVGTPGINWEFTIQEGEYEGRKQWTNHWFAPTALGFLKNFLAAVGVDASGQLDLDPDSIVGKQLVIKVAVRKYQGEDTNDVKGYYPADSEHDDGAKGSGSNESSSLMP